MTTTERFDPGDVIVHRDVQQGRIWYARDEIVVQDRPEGTLTYWGPGAEVRVPASDGGAQARVPIAPWVLQHRAWHTFSVLCHWRPGDHHSIWLFWEPHTWRFDRWYVNLQAPFVRTALGFDATDDVLDIEIRPNGEWRWKDEDELEEAVRAGILSTKAAEAIRSEGRGAVERMKAGEEPFTEKWIHWRPDDRWSVPKLPAGWQSLRPIL